MVNTFNGRILAEASNLKRAGEEFANDKLGTLTIAATHTQARYALPKAVAAFKRRKRIPFWAMLGSSKYSAAPSTSWWRSCCSS